MDYHFLNLALEAVEVCLALRLHGLEHDEALPLPGGRSVGEVCGTRAEAAASLDWGGVHRGGGRRWRRGGRLAVLDVP